MKSNPSFWAIVGLAFLLRATLLVLTGPTARYALTSDSSSYIEPAQNLLRYGRFASTIDKKFVPERYRTPGYPVFLLPFLSTEGGVHQRAVQWSQAVLSSFSAGLVYLAALAFWKRRAAALVAGGGMAFDVSNALHCTFILTDILFVFLLALVLWCFVKRWYTAAGALTAAAAFVRPIGVYYPAFLACLLCLSGLMKTAELSWKQLAFFVAVSILPLLAWSSRNYSVSGQWSFSSIQDANIYIVRAALVKMEEEGMAYNEALNNLALSFREAQGSRALPGNSESQLQGQWATHYLLTHWTGYLRVVLKDIVKLLAGNSMKVIAWAVLKDDYYDPAMVPTHSTQTPLFQARDLVRRHPWLGAALAFNLMFLALMYVLSAIGVILAWKEAGWGRTLVLLSAVIYFSALSLGVDAHARYRLPLMPTLFFFAGGGTLQCLKRRARRGL